MPSTSAAIRIRAVRPADFDAWLPLWNGYNAFYARADETALVLKVTRTTWSRFLDDEDAIFALVPAWDCGRCHRANLCRVLRRNIATYCM